MVQLSGWLLLVLPLGALATQSQFGSWRSGRATSYGVDAWSIHEGSCGYGVIHKDEPLGWDVAAMPDVDPDYPEGCGRCYEVQCRQTAISDNYGQSFDRSAACQDPTKSVVVRIVDTCPCNYPANAYSNKRWCCGDAPHLDMSAWAFEKLAELRWGVMGIRFRAVPCDYQPPNPAPEIANPSPPDSRYPQATSSGPVPDRAWPEDRPEMMNPEQIYRYGSLQNGWVDRSYNAVINRNSVQGIGGSAPALCATISSKGAISLAPPVNAFNGRTSLVLWVYVGDANNDGVAALAKRNIMVVPGGPAGDCYPISLRNTTATGFAPACAGCTDYFYKFEIFLSAFAGFGSSSMITQSRFFKMGCGGNAVGALTYMDFRNYEASPIDLCMDYLELD